MSEWYTVAVTIGGDTISDDIYELDIWAEELFYVSRFEIKLINDDNEWYTDFAVYDAVTISINGVEMLKGFLDDIEQHTGEGGADESNMILKGRGMGFNLQNLYFTRNYPDGTWIKADDIIFDSLGDAQADLDEADKITYVTPSTAPDAPTKFSKTYLFDAYKELCERFYYNGYVDNDKVLHFFPQGDASEHTTVDLSMVANSANNNILKMQWGERVGSSIKNYIEFYGGSIKDHWTDGVLDIDAVQAWVGTTNCETPVDEYYYKLPRGVASVEIRATAYESPPTTTQFIATLAFPRYNYTLLNLSNSAECSYWTYNEYPGTTTGFEYIRPQLTDRLGNIIEFTKTVVTTDDLGVTEGIQPFRWSNVKFPVGEGLTIKSTILPGYWYSYATADSYSVAGGDWTNAAIDNDYDGANHTSLILTGGTLVPDTEFSVGQKITLANCEDSGNNGSYTIKALGSNYIYLWETLATDNATDTAMTLSAAFDWKHVEKISIHCGYQAIAGVTPKVYIDYLTIPSVVAISIQESAASVAAYGLRMFRESHPEAMNQVQLDAMSISCLDRSKNALSILKIIANGQTGSKYAGQSLDVRAVPYGISDLTKYRITKLHHMVRCGRAVKKASNYVTEYELVEHSIGGVTLYNDAYRIGSYFNQSMVTFDRLKDFRDRMSIDDYTDDVHTYSRIPGNDEITAHTVSSGAITGDMIQSGAIITRHVSSGTITTTQILSGAVTTYNVASGAIVADLISSGAIAVYHLTANSVTTDKIEANAITAGLIAADAVTANAISANAVWANKILANAVTADKIAANSITANHIEANAIEANKILANAVTTNKIIGQAVSIEKIASNVGTPGIQFLYTKFAEYEMPVPDTEYEKAWGVNAYTRTIQSQEGLQYHARRVEFEAKQQLHEGRVDVYVVNGSGLYTTAILTSGFATDLRNTFGLDQLDAGSYAFDKRNATNLPSVTLNSGGTYSLGGVGAAHNGAGSYARWRLYTFYSSTYWVTNNFSGYTHLGVMAKANNFSGTNITLRVGLHTDMSGASYFYDDIVLPVTSDANTTDYATKIITLSGASVVGTPDLGNINKLTIECMTATPYGTGSYIDVTWLGLARAAYAKSFLVSGTTYYESGDDLDVKATQSGDIQIWYMHSEDDDQGGYLRYPASDVRGISYLVDVTTV